MKQKAVQKLIEYFEQQLRMQRESKIKYTGEEAYLDALDICKNAYKTMSKQQTAVGWLIEQLQAPCRGIPIHIIEQANAMFEQQIIDANEDSSTKDDEFLTGEQYYNETFKKD